MGFLRAAPVMPASKPQLSASAFQHAGFTVHHADDNYAVVTLDHVEVHFWRDGQGPASCYLHVDDVGSAFEAINSSPGLRVSGDPVVNGNAKEFAFRDEDDNLYRVGGPA